MRALNSTEIETLERNGCAASPDWSGISVGESFDAARVRNVTFIGKVAIVGWTSVSYDNVNIPFCLFNSTISECEIGENSCIVNTSFINNYNIYNNVIIINNATITGANLPETVEPLNESGIYGLQMHPQMTSNIAHIAIFHGHRAGLREAINRLAANQSGRCYIGEGAIIEGTTEIRDSIILSSNDAPTTIKAGATVRHSVVQEGAHISDHAKVERSFVGQAVEISSGMTMENSMAFANSQLLCGEAVSAFCGPFTVSHHKTSLLIAGAYSFFNAGSATNASNHHYRLGPRHQAVYSRGVKTGSGSYILEPAKIGAFTMVVGHHKTNPDTTALPFSLLIESEGNSILLPAQNLRTISLARDEQKWRSRDKRPENLRRDIICTDTFNPLIIEQLLNAAKTCRTLTEKGTEMVIYNGCRMKALLVQRAEQAYKSLAEAILIAKFFETLDKKLSINADIQTDWLDIGGMIITRKRIEEIEHQIINNNINSIDNLNVTLAEAASHYAEDETLYVRRRCKELFGIEVNTPASVLESLAQRCVDFFADFEHSLIADARRDGARKLAISYSADYPEEAGDTFEQLYATANSDGENAASAFCKARTMAAKAFICNFANK